MMNYSLQTYREYMNQNHLVGTISSAPNPNLGWEKVNDVKVGLDLGFLDGRLSLETEYYSRLTKGAVDDKPLYVTTDSPIRRPISPACATGVSSSRSGAGSFRPDWTLDASVNFAFNSNKVLEYASSVSFQHMKLNYYEGYPPGRSSAARWSGSTPDGSLRIQTAPRCGHFERCGLHRRSQLPLLSGEPGGAVQRRFQPFGRIPESASVGQRRLFVRVLRL